jgi:hypothetical protein
MKRLPLALALFTACASKPAQPTVGNTATEIPAETSDGGDGYGGDGYGGDEYGGLVGEMWGSDSYGGDAYGGYAPVAPSTPDLVGLWVGPCEPVLDKQFSRRTLEITADRWDERADVFADAACTKRRFTLHETGTFIFGAASSEAIGAWQVDLTYATLDVTAHDKKAATALGKSCAVKLKAGSPTSILASGCKGLGITGNCPVYYDLVSTESGALQLGESTIAGACSADLRPSALASQELIWQWPSLNQAECDALGAEYMRLMTCSSLPPSAKPAIRQGMAQMHTGFKDLLKLPPEALRAAADSCRQATDAIKQAASSMGC